MGHQGSHRPLKFAFLELNNIIRIECIAYIPHNNLSYLLNL